MDELLSMPLNGLRAVAAVARAGTLAGAAQALRVTPGAVSQQVTRVEALLGQRLFDRRPEGMVPTPRGREVCALLAGGFEQLAAAVRLARAERAAALTISVAPIFAARWLIWRLPRFAAAHPDIRVRLDNQLALVDPNASDIDFAIRIGRGPYPGVEAEPILTQFIVPVCAPALAPRVATVADLARVPVVTEPQSMFGWDAWLGPEGAAGMRLGEGPVYPDASMCLDAAMTGAGVFLAFEVLCWDALSRGQVVAPIPRMHPNGLTYWLVSARNRPLSEPQRAFRRWLKGELAASGMGSGEVPVPPG